MSEKSEEHKEEPQHTLTPFPSLSGEIDPGGSFVYDGLSNQEEKVLDEQDHPSAIALSSALQDKPLENEHDQLSLMVTGAIENKLLKKKPSEIGNGEWEEAEEESSPEMHQQLNNSIPETSDGFPSCSAFTKAKQTRLPPGSCTAFIDGKSLPSWVSKQKSPWKPIIQVYEVQPSQEESGEVKVKPEDKRSEPAVVFLPPKPLQPFYMRPLSREFKPILLPTLQAFRESMEGSPQPFFALATHSP